MNKIVKIVIPLVIFLILVILTIGFVVRSNSNDNPYVPDYHGPKGILFLYPEAGGFDVPDFGGFPDPETVKENFHTIAVVANHAAHDFVSHWEDKHVVALQKASGVPVERWLAYYFGKDSKWACQCNASGCWRDKRQTKLPNITVCNTDVMKQVKYDVTTYGIVGIMFDDEVGDSKLIADAMEAAATETDIKLGWTLSLGTAKKCRPRQDVSKPCIQGQVGNMPWDYCFGQAYTDTTADFYDGSCKFSPNFWDLVRKSYDSSVTAERGVPMVCGAGCGIKDFKKGNNTPLCVDERMTGTQISTLINSRPQPAEFKWRNFAIWYGTIGTNMFGCVYDDQKCATECCDSWKTK